MYLLSKQTLPLPADTPSPGPPVDSEKDRHSSKHKREEDRTQKDRCVEVYPETVRQRQRNMMAAANKVKNRRFYKENQQFLFTALNLS